MNFEDFKKLWNSLSEEQRDKIRNKAKWEHMTLWAVCIEWPDIWRGINKEQKEVAPR